MSRDGKRWEVALGVQAVSGQASWLGARLMMTYLALSVSGKPSFVALQASMFALAGLLLALPAGRFADRFGSASIGTAGLLVSVAGIAIALTTPTRAGLLGAAFVIGLGHICTLVGQQSFVARAAAALRPEAAFGTLTAASSLGQLIGPIVVTSVASVGTTSPTAPNTTLGLVVCCVLVAVALPPFFVLHGFERRAETGHRDSSIARLPVRAMLQIPGVRRSLLVSGAVIVAADLLTSFVPLWAVEHSITPIVVGWLLTLRGLFALASRLGMASLVDRFGRERLIVIALTTAVIAIGVLPFAGAWTAVPIMCLLGLGLGLPQPLTMAWLISLSPSDTRGAVLGMRMTGNRIAQVSIPLAVGGLAGPGGVAAIFWTTSAILAAAAVLAIKPISERTPAAASPGP